MSTSSVAYASSQPQAPNAPKKRAQYKCGHCKRTGHNRKTCPMRNVITKRGETAARKLNYCDLTAEDQHAKTDAPTEQQQEEEEQVCAICFEKCGEHDPTSTPCCELKCKHKFHTSCLFTWLSKNTSCPMCRDEVPELKQPDAEVSIPSPALMQYLIRQVSTSFRTTHAPNTPLMEWSNIYTLLHMRLSQMSPGHYRTYSEIAELLPPLPETSTTTTTTTTTTNASI